MLIVEPKGKTVSISGGVNVPGIYELKQSETLEDLLELAKDLNQGTSGVVEIYGGNADPIQVFNESDNMQSFIPAHGLDIKIPEFISYPIPIKQVKLLVKLRIQEFIHLKMEIG